MQTALIANQNELKFVFKARIYLGVGTQRNPHFGVSYQGKS